MKPIALAAVKLADPLAERARDSTAQAITELQGLPAASLRVIRNVVMVDTQNTIVTHGLGRAPVWVGPSAIRDAVAPTTIRDLGAGSSGLYAGPIDRSKFIVLRCDGSNCTIDVAVF